MTNNQRIDRKTTISDRRSSSSFFRVFLSRLSVCLCVCLFYVVESQPKGVMSKNEEEKSRRERHPFEKKRDAKGIRVDKHSFSADMCAIRTSSCGFTRRAHHLKQTEELFRLRLLLYILCLLRGVVVPFLSRLCVSLRLFDFLPPRLLYLSDLFGFDFRSKPTQRADISIIIISSSSSFWCINNSG